jgi:hypothetical protein
MEGRERHATHDDASEMIVPLVQPSKDIEDKVAAGEHSVEVAKGVGHPIHLATVVTHQRSPITKLWNVASR